MTMRTIAIFVALFRAPSPAPTVDAGVAQPGVGSGSAIAANNCKCNDAEQPKDEPPAPSHERGCNCQTLTCP